MIKGKTLSYVNSTLGTSMYFNYVPLFIIFVIYSCMSILRITNDDFHRFLSYNSDIISKIFRLHQWCTENEVLFYLLYSDRLKPPTSGCILCGKLLGNILITPAVALITMYPDMFNLHFWLAGIFFTTILFSLSKVIYSIAVHYGRFLNI